MSNATTGIFLFVAAAVLLHNAASVRAGLDAIDTYEMKDMISISIVDLDGDNLKETIVSSDKGVRALNSDATERWGFEVDGLKAVYVSDTDGDGKKDVIISSGREVNAIEKGNLYILDYRGKPLRQYEFSAGDPYPHLLYYSLASVDLDDNGYEEIVGGCSNGIYALKDTYDKINWSYRTNETVRTVMIRDTGGLKDILAASSATLYVLSTSGVLKRNYTVSEGIKKISVADVAVSPGDEIILVSEDDSIHVLNRDLEYAGGTNFMEGVTDLESFDMNNDSIPELIIGSKKGFNVLNGAFSTIMKYVTNEEVRGIYFLDWDGDKDKEAVFSSGGYVYALGKDGSLKDKAYVAQPVDSFIADDLDYDGYWDLVVKSGRTIYFFENRQSKVKGAAREKYITAKSFFEAGRYSDALGYLQEARSIYDSIGDYGNVQICEELEKEIAAEMKEEKRQEADSYCQSAERYIERGEYAQAIEELSNAKGMYEEINDSAGLSKCGLLSEKIRTDATPKKSEDLNMSSLFNPPKDVNIFPIFSIFLLVAIVLLLAILLVNRK